MDTVSLNSAYRDNEWNMLCINNQFTQKNGTFCSASWLAESAFVRSEFKDVVSWKELRRQRVPPWLFFRGKERGPAGGKNFLVHPATTFGLVITPGPFQLPNTASNNTCIHFCRHVWLIPVSPGGLWPPWEQGPWQSYSAQQKGGSTSTTEWMNHIQYLKIN